jgi:L-ascorbate metabolism protein UlaG (beta-lactamase superfamily)
MVKRGMPVTVKWLGHASFQIRVDDTLLYIDPYAGEYTEIANIILLTHSHHDHCDPAKIAQASNTDTLVIGPEVCASEIEGSFIPIHLNEEKVLGPIKIKAVAAYNLKRFRSPGTPFHPQGMGVGYLIMAEGKTIYHAGDTDFIPEMRELGEIDLALLPSGDTYTMDTAEAVDAAIAINPKTVISMHRWDTDPTAFTMELKRKSTIQSLVLEPNDEFRLS